MVKKKKKNILDFNILDADFFFFFFFLGVSENAVM